MAALVAVQGGDRLHQLIVVGHMGLGGGAQMAVSGLGPVDALFHHLVLIRKNC